MLKHFMNGNPRKAIEAEIKEAGRLLLIAEGEVEMREHLVREAKSSAQSFRDRIARLSIYRASMMTEDEILARMEVATVVLS